MKRFVMIAAATLALLSPGETEVNEFTYDDAQLLMQVAQAEAGNQGPDGMWLTMSVILNRVKDETFPNTIEEVIYQPHQFSTANKLDKVEITPEAHEALARIEQGEVAPEIIAFESKKSHVLNDYFMSAFTYRDHIFYTKKEGD